MSPLEAYVYFAAIAAFILVCCALTWVLNRMGIE